MPDASGGLARPHHPVRTGASVLVPLLLTLAAPAPVVTQPHSFTEREVVFRNGPVELAGTLVLPDAEGPVPAVVFLHGSGPMTRAGFRPYAEEFAALGVAGLFYDKRGTGGSDGSWITSSLDDLADDALAAVAHLEGVEGVDPDRIGFWGVSQAGWIAPLAASRSGAVRFMMIVSGGGASPRESELFSYRKAFDDAGLSDAERERALEVVDAYFAYLATGEGRSELHGLIEGIGHGPLAPLAEQLGGILPSEENRPNWAWVATHDPAPHIRSVKGPVLLLFGDRDRAHPTELAVEAWREALAAAGNDDVTLVVFPGAGHGIRMREGHAGEGRAPFADGYAEVMLGWLWSHVVRGG